jgi:hypothetical protein
MKIIKTGQSRLSVDFPISLWPHFSDHMFVAEYLDGRWPARIEPFERF